MITFSGWQLADIILRALAVGQLTSLIFAQRHAIRSAAWIAKTSVMLCVIAYLALTAPVSNHHYGWLRPPLLLITDLTAFALLNYYWFSVYGKSLWQALPLALQIIALTWLMALVVLFFGYDGNHLLHDINHLVGFLLLCAILLDCIRGYQDDLVERRRLFRRLMIATISAYMLGLTLLELTDSHLRDNVIFSLGNAILACCFISVLVWRQFRRESDKTHVTTDNNHQSVINLTADSPPSEETSPTVLSPEIQRLVDTMQGGFYTQHDVSVGKLASALQLPEHQLRALINREMGFDNFSQFVNSYRIPAVCAKLRDPARKKDPILTIALETGYNSVASFNRSFKQQQGMTPSEFRAQF